MFQAGRRTVEGRRASSGSRDSNGYDLMTATRGSRIMPDARGVVVPPPPESPEIGGAGRGHDRVEGAAPVTGWHSVKAPLPGSAAWAAVWLVVIVVSTFAATVLVLTGSDSPVRPAVILFFAITCPGMSLVRILRLEEPLAELVLAVATSIALGGLVGGFLLYYGIWAPESGLMILVGITVAAIAADRVAHRIGLGRQPESETPFEEPVVSPGDAPLTLPWTIADDASPPPISGRGRPPAERKPRRPREGGRQQAHLSLHAPAPDATPVQDGTDDHGGGGA
jgi:hypothetical protein